MEKLAVLVLAAGKSSRMKSIKQLEKINNKTLLDITLEKTKQLNIKDVFCVLGANAEIIKEKIATQNITFINNNNFENGLSSSIVAGMQHFKNAQLNFTGVLILLADQPDISIAYLNSLVELFHQYKTKIIASNYDQTFGVPAIFPKDLFVDLQKLKGDKGAKLYLNDSQELIVTAKEKTNLIDIDTQEQLKRYRNR